MPLKIVSLASALLLDPFVDEVPDETTILNFQHVLDKNDLHEVIFKEIDQHLEDKVLLMKQPLPHRAAQKKWQA